MKTMILFAVLAALSFHLTEAQPKITYDKFKQVTTVSSEPASIYGHGPSLIIAAFAACPGDSLCHPATITMLFASSNDDWAFMKSHKLIMIVDSIRIDLGDVAYESSVRKTRPFCRETMILRMPFKDFNSIANAKLVEFQLGPGEYSLDEDDREELRDFCAKFL